MARRAIFQLAYLKIYKELKNHFHPPGWIISSSRNTLQSASHWKMDLQTAAMWTSLYFQQIKRITESLRSWITHFKASSFFSPFTLYISLPLDIFAQLCSITKHPGNKLCHLLPNMCNFFNTNNKEKPESQVSCSTLLPKPCPGEGQQLLWALRHNHQGRTSELCSGQLSRYASWLQVHNRLWWCVLRHTCIVHMAKQPTAISNFQSEISVLSGHCVLSFWQVCITLQHNTQI